MEGIYGIVRQLQSPCSGLKRGLFGYREADRSAVSAILVHLLERVAHLPPEVPFEDEKSPELFRRQELPYLALVPLAFLKDFSVGIGELIREGADAFGILLVAERFFEIVDG